MPAKPNELQITRIYDAPVELVWEAWTDLKHVEKWWGPRGFTLTTKSKELRPGGKWIYTMHGPDGTDYPNIATYHEVVKHEKLVYDHGGNEERDKLFTVTVTFKEEEKGRTTMCMTMAMASEEEARKIKQFVKDAGGNSTWDRLGEYLENETSGRDAFIINRSFEADLETVFEMWVNPEHFAKWLGPKGSTMTFINANVKEGQCSLWSMTFEDGQIKYGRLSYKKICPPHLLVYTQNFTDEDGNLCKPNFAPTYPDMLLTTVTFAKEAANETRVTVKWEVFGEATATERDTFNGMKASMTGGWSGSFDKLDALISSTRVP